MKRLFQVSIASAALLAGFQPSANAAWFSPVYSNITDVQLWMWDMNLLTAEAPGYFSGFAFHGMAYDEDNDGHVDDADLYMTGETGFTVAGVEVRLTFDLKHGGFASGSGITFRDGTVQVDVNSPTSGWIPFSTVDASVDNLKFLANQPGHYPGTGQTTAGIVADTLPGLWDGQVGSPGFNRAVAVLSILGADVGLYMDGFIATYPPLDPHDDESTFQLTFDAPAVPVPASVWLFGSCLASLAAVQRRRRTT